MCKHQRKAEFLAKLEAAQLVNSLPDSDDLQKVTGLTPEAFVDPETNQVDTVAMKSMYDFTMGVLFAVGDDFAYNCKLFSNLKLC